MWTYLAPILLLLASNVFMTVAWYGHLKFKTTPLLTVILVSWGIAFFEYCLQVPANRIGADASLTLPQLKIIQEIITLSVFAAFAVVYMGERIGWNHAGAALCMVGAAWFVFRA
jgi:hypothetical protein